MYLICVRSGTPAFVRPQCNLTLIHRCLDYHDMLTPPHKLEVCTSCAWICTVHWPQYHPRSRQLWYFKYIFLSLQFYWPQMRHLLPPDCREAQVVNLLHLYQWMQTGICTGWGGSRRRVRGCYVASSQAQVHLLTTPRFFDDVQDGVQVCCEFPIN